MTTLSELGISVEPTGLVSAPGHPYPERIHVSLNDSGKAALPHFREPVTIQRSTCPDTQGTVYIFDASESPIYRKAEVNDDDWFSGFI